MTVNFRNMYELEGSLSYLEKLKQHVVKVGGHINDAYGVTLRLVCAKEE